jgi:hypothetical protein
MRVIERFPLVGEGSPIDSDRTRLRLRLDARAELSRTVCRFLAPAVPEAMLRMPS